MGSIPAKGRGHTGWPAAPDGEPVFGWRRPGNCPGHAAVASVASCPSGMSKPLDQSPGGRTGFTSGYSASW